MRAVALVARVFARTRSLAGLRAASAAGLLVAAAPPLHALDPKTPVGDFAVDAWQDDAGLPANFVYSITQTRDGYLWLGTRGGLGRFDGVRFQTFGDARPNELTENEVWAVAEDVDGSIWIGTFGGGLSRLHHGRISRMTIADGLPSDMVSALRLAPNGSLWVGTYAGLAELRHGRVARVYDRRHGLPADIVNDLHLDPEGTLWIGTDRGLAALTERGLVGHASSGPGLDKSVQSIAGGGRDPLWLATTSGLVRFDKGGSRLFGARDGLPASPALAVALEPSGNLWIGTAAGLFRYDGRRFEPFVQELSRTTARRVLQTVALRDIQSLCLDREGSLWIGTRYDGLARLRNASFSNPLGTSEEASAPNISVFGDSRGAIWLSSGDSAVRVHQKGSTTVYPLGAPALFAEDRQGNLWTATRGLYRFRGDRMTLVPAEGLPGTEPTAVFADARGDLWLGYREGLFRLSRGVVRRYTADDGVAGNQVRGIAEDRKGGLWICTRDAGVTRLAPEGATHYGPRQGLTGTTCQAVFADSRDVIWVATRQGLNRIHEGRVARITTDNGLPANFLYQILEDDHGHLWFTGARGVFRASREGLNAVADGRARTVEVRAFGTQDGMRTSVMVVPGQPTAWKARDGRLWFATMRGPTAVDPARLARNDIAPRVRIEEVAADGVSRAPWDELSFPPGHGSVEIRYTGLSLVAPDRVRFRCMLDGFDDDWQDMGTRRVAYYTNLPPRSYRFRVIAFNEDGVPSRETDALSFSLAPHWYQAWWLRALAVLSALAGLRAAYRWRGRQARARHEELARLVDERTEELRSEVEERRSAQARLSDQIVERQKAEEEVRRLNDGLESRVRERTAELAEAFEALAAANRALEEDNAERIRAKEALEAERERLSVTLRSVGDGVIATDIDGRILLMSRAAEELTGWTQGEAQSRPLGEVLQVVDLASRAPLPDRIASIAGGARRIALSEPTLLLTRDGREIAIQHSVAPIRDPDSRVRGAVIAFRDVTERLRAEEQMQKTQKLEALGMLAGGIAHDFNNLLTGIFGFIELARGRAGEKERVERSLDRAREVIDRARGLTGQLLTFTRAGAPVTRPVDLGLLLRDAARFALSGSNVSFELDVAPDLWACQADALQLDQVVDNLLLNARQAMPHGGTVTLRARNLELAPGASSPPLRPGRYLQIEIRDTGVGIAREHQARVFDPFFTTKPTGTGLGLATAYSVVQKHGGHIELHSEPGAGATFVLSLPAADQPPDPAWEKPRALPHGVGRVLVMDDEEHVREIAQGMLEDLGYTVEAARDGNEAAAIFARAASRGEAFDAVILDLTVPGGAGGVATLERLKDLDAGVRAVASSGYSSDPIMARPQEFGFAAFLAKPYTAQELATTLRRVLAREPAAAEEPLTRAGLPGERPR